MNPNCNTISVQQIKDFIIVSTTQNDPCLTDTLREVIDELWNIAGLYACSDPVSRYLETRLKVIQLLMSCSAKQFDTKDTFTETFQGGEANTRMDGFAQAQASNQGFRVNDSSSCADYNDFARAKMRSGSNRDAKSCSRDSSFSTYTDSGAGKNKLTADATRMSENGTTVTNTSQSIGATTGGSARKGCNYTVSDERGEGFGQGIPFSVPPVYASAVGSSSSYSASRWRHHMSDASSSKQNDTRNGTSHRTYGRSGLTDNRGLSESCSYFNANVFSDSNGTSSSRNADDSTAFRNEDAHAEGLGTSFSKADARGEVTAQGTSKVHNDGNGKRDSSRFNRTIGDSIYNSQIFKNLKIMHEITLQNMNYVNDIANAQRSPVWSNGVCQLIRDGYSDIKLWMLQSTGYRNSIFNLTVPSRHPYPVKDCCDYQSTLHRSGGQLGRIGSITLCGTCGLPDHRQDYSKSTSSLQTQGKRCSCG